MKKKIETMQLPPPIARKGKNARSSVPHLNKKREAKKQGQMEMLERILVEHFTMSTRLRALQQHIDELRRLADLMEADSPEQEAAVYHIESLLSLGDMENQQ